MNYLKISNKGLLDIEALTLLGASSKREDSTKIGMFGSGNKYALAFLLRNNYEVRIFAGTEEIKITCVEKNFRDKKFNVIAINGAETSITTDFGKDWQLWQAIRELYCNAVDEGAHTLEYVQNIEPQENHTHFYIKTRSEITNFVGDFDNYFSENREIVFENEYGKILSKKDKSHCNLYRKGIRCLETQKDSIYDYDLKEVEIDENRLVKYAWQIPSKIWNLIYQCTNKEVIKNILFNCNESNYIERINGDFASVNQNYMSPEYLEVLKSLTLAPSGLSGLLSTEEIGSTTVIPNEIFNQAKSVLKNENLATKFKVYKEYFFIEIEVDAITSATIEKAKDFFTECNYEKPLQYPITIARFTDKNFLGFADTENQRIILSEICIAKGVQMVIETIIEEFIHLKYEVNDETRGFQNAAITEIVSLLKTKNAYLV